MDPESRGLDYLCFQPFAVSADQFVGGPSERRGPCGIDVKDNAAGIADDEKEIMNRDRKRLRDRKAQQEHRKRKKSYVEGLETQIQALRKRFEPGQTEELWNENEELRQQVRSHSWKCHWPLTDGFPARKLEIGVD